MFCNKCGNILADGALFCSFCGAKNVLAQPDRQTVVTMQPNAEAPELPVIESAQIQPPAQQATMESIQASYTTEQEIPRMAPNFGGAAPAVKQKKQKIQKYYTFGHLLLCLIAAGIMAITAGVFAGLYFTAI